jgi:hypothetical protein
MLPLIRNRFLPSIGVMHELAMRHIFESISSVDARVLEEGLEGWSKKIELNESDRWEIRRIISALEANEVGHFNRAKEILKKNGWHYRQLYKVGLPFITNPKKCRTFGKG